MKQKIITAVILAFLVLAGLLTCGIIGYLNDHSDRAEPNFGFPDEPLSSATPNAVDLVYCYNPVDLCVISFGQDNAGNLLIVIRNNIPGLKEFYAKLRPARSFLTEPAVTSIPPTAFPDPNLALTPTLPATETLEPTETETPTPVSTGTPDIYTCQKVQFASDIYYCMGGMIPDGTMVTMDVYSQIDDRLIASGQILVSTVATPAPTVSPMPAPPELTPETISPTETLLPQETASPTSSNVKPTQTSPASPQPTP